MQERDEDLATGSVAAGDNIPAAGSSASSSADSSPTVATSAGDESAGDESAGDDSAGNDSHHQRMAWQHGALATQLWTHQVGDRRRSLLYSYAQLHLQGFNAFWFSSVRFHVE